MIRLSWLVLLSVTVPCWAQEQRDGDGFTIWVPHADTRKVYVSSTRGSDGNSGLTASDPVNSVSKGMSLLRNGRPDWLLLRAGDTFGERIGPWLLSGRSEEAPILISRYGAGPRPAIRPPGDGFYIPSNLSSDQPKVNHIAIVGLSFYAHSRDPDSNTFSSTKDSTGLHVLGYGDNLTIEDCAIRSFCTGIVAKRRDGLLIRRCLIVDQYNEDGFAHGFYQNYCSRIRIEECVFDHNGWYGDRATGGSVKAVPTVFNHDIYSHSAFGDVVLRGNIFSRTSSDVQLRGGGAAINNLFLWQPKPLVVGSPDPRNSAQDPAGVEADVRDNVILHSVAMTPAEQSKKGMRFFNIKSGIVDGNLVAHLDGSPERALGIAVDDGGSDAYPTRSITLTDNIFWKYASGGIASFGNVERIVRTGNYYWDWTVDSQNHDAADVAWTDPGRTIVSYQASLGEEATVSAFLAAIRRQSAENWDPRYTAAAVNSYIRAGFQADDSGGNGDENGGGDNGNGNGNGETNGGENGGENGKEEDFTIKIAELGYVNEPVRLTLEGPLEIQLEGPRVVRPGEEFRVVVMRRKYDFAVNWGDGNTQELQASHGTALEHTYQAVGKFGVTVTRTPISESAPEVVRLATVSVSERTQLDGRAFVGDFDGDGRQDIAVLRPDNTWVIVQYADGALVTSFWGSWPDGDYTQVYVGDWNGDGKDDVSGLRDGSERIMSLSTGTAFVLRSV